ncbi:MAG: toll/interleukin-1 receptor domain-containing protein [Hyphomonadaceae bacterium]|nr:toll/interleukin-1 receptor domain-containing protein [Hyphomonadaceae bacterium]
MFAFIAHSEADQTAADDLKAFLKTRGLVAETESGARGFRFLQSTDVVIALWSQKSVFGTHRMLMEKRMLEAWADGRLVLVKLDHSFLPVGMRDLAAIDASAESGRKIAFWPQVERAAREIINRALTERSEKFWKAPPPSKPENSGGGGFFGSRKKEAAPPPSAASATGPEPQPSPATESKAAAPPPSVVFISYAHADNAAVEPVVSAVKDAGRDVWIDKGGINPGDNWAGEIVRGIKGAKGVMVLCSPSAFESDHIKREVYLADRYKKPMLPVFIADAQPPEDFEYFFAGVQWLELFKLPEADRSAAIGKALTAV